MTDWIDEIELPEEVETMEIPVHEDGKLVGSMEFGKFYRHYLRFLSKPKFPALGDILGRAHKSMGGEALYFDVVLKEAPNGTEPTG
jgi:hypothetical protein